MDRTVPILGMAVLCAVALGACGDDPGAGQRTARDFPMTVENCAREVTIEEPPERVFTYGAGASTLMAAAGAADRIIGRSLEGGAPLGDYEDELRGIPEISPDGEISPEVIIGERPDLVMGYVDDVLLEGLATVGIDTLVDASFCYQFGTEGEEVTWDDLYGDVESYGRLFGTEDAAAETVAGWRERVAAVEEKFRGTPERSVAVVYVTETSLQVYGKESVARTQVETLGFTDVFGELGKGAEVGFEKVIEADPDVIVAAYYGPEGVTSDEDAQQAFRALPGLDQLDAVREGRIIALEGTFIESSALNVDGLETMAEKIGGFFP